MKKNYWSFFRIKQNMWTLISKEIKNTTHFLLLQTHPREHYQCSFALWTTLQSSHFCQWWPSLILCQSFSIKYVSDFNTDVVFFLSEKELFSWTYLLKTKPQKRIFKIWDTLFELIQIALQCSNNYFQIFYHKKLELLEIT